MGIQKAFPTLIYSQKIAASAATVSRLNQQILLEIRDVEALDRAGKVWSSEHYKNGFTTYATANELHKNFGTFTELEKRIDAHVKKFAKALDYDLGKRPLTMISCWANVMKKNSHHGMHIHPLSVISGTYYVTVPRGSSALKFEDPRLSKFMATPPKKIPTKEVNRQFVEVPAKPGNLVLFESWLRHEVPVQSVSAQRISVSFNYAWGD